MDLEYLKELSGEDYYNCIISLPYTKPKNDIRDPVNKVYGCGSDVWVDLEDGNIVFESSSIFVQGLLCALVSQIDINTVLDKTLEHYDIFSPEKITMRRYRGLKSSLEKIQNIVEYKYNLRG